MDVVVFTGPTLNPADARVELNAEFLPPVAQGDVYLAARRRPSVIGIIDGYFDRVPAVWHKEILWAMSQGIYVFGSASMGALRAVELAPFGMIGVGSVFMDFHMGALEDDDEVAIIHGPKEGGYRCLSDAMVNIRATVRAALRDEVIDTMTADTLTKIAKGLLYPDRTFKHICVQAIEQGVRREVIQPFLDWLPDGAVNRKRLDALGMLRAIKQFLDLDPGPFRPDFQFYHTDAWEAARKRSLQVRHPRIAESHESLSEILEDLKIHNEYRSLERTAAARLLALEQAASLGIKANPEAVQRQVDRFRVEHDLAFPEAFSNWLVEQQLDDSDATYRFFSDEAAIERVMMVYSQEVPQSIIDELRASGKYGEVLRRIEHKNEVLQEGLAELNLRELNLTETGLWAWYFPNVLGVPLPDDIEAHGISAGFRDIVSFRAAALREYSFRNRVRRSVGP